MLLVDINTWISEATSYWYAQIEATSYQNQAEMKAAVSAYLADLETAYQNYLVSVSRTLFLKALLATNGYVTMKDRMTVDPPGPGVPTIFSSFKEWFVCFTYTLPDYAGLLEIVELDLTTGEVNPLPAYSNLLTVINNAAQQDNDTLSNIPVQVGNALLEQTCYLTFKHPRPTTTMNIDTSIKDYLLETYDLQEVIDVFGWDVPGITD